MWPKWSAVLLSLLYSESNNAFCSWKLGVSIICDTLWATWLPMNPLISSYLKPELINSHSRRLCCCSASPSRETNQTMGVIERRNRWHYWILITSFSTPNTAITWLQDVCVSARLCSCVCIRRGWSAEQTSGSSGSHSGWKKVVSGYQRTQPCLDGSLLSQCGELLPYGEGPNYPPPMTKSTFDYILRKAPLKASIQWPLLYVFSLIIKNGCYLLMISLMSFFYDNPWHGAARCLTCLLIYALEWLGFHVFVLFSF